MAVILLLDRIQAEMAEVFEQRSTPEDVIEFACSMTLVAGVHDGDEDDHDEHQCATTALSVYATMACPESGAGTTSSCHVLVPMGVYQEDGSAGVANYIWDALSARRIEHAMEHALGPDGD